VDVREKSCGIMYFEEKLYILEQLIQLMDSQSSLEVILALRQLLNFKDDGEEVFPFGKIKNDKNPFIQ
jgi:hypothetical protein